MTNPAMNPSPAMNPRTQQLLETPPPFKKGLPTRENCDLANPYEMFLWCFVGLPGLNGAPMLLPIDYYQMVSKRLYDLGVRLVEEPTLVYQKPDGSDPNWATSPGKWVPAEDVAAGKVQLDEQTAVSALVDTLPPQQQAVFFQELWRRHSDEQRRKMMRGEAPPGTLPPEPEPVRPEPPQALHPPKDKGGKDSE